MDIEDHKFFEVDTKAEDQGEFIEITYPDYFQSTDFCGSVVNLYRCDVIAMAKHFKLTPEDLNE